MANINNMYKNPHVQNVFDNYVASIKTRIAQIINTVEESRVNESLPPLSPVQKVALIGMALDTAALLDEDTWAQVSDECLGTYGYDDIGVVDDEEDF